MKSQDKTNGQLLNELACAKNEIRELSRINDENHKLSELLHKERKLYQDLANCLPLGVYRLKVFRDKGILEEQWYQSNDAPYIVEFVNDHFCEILNLDKNIFEKNPGIILNYIATGDKREFVRKNVEANLNTSTFMWEGRFLVKNKIKWMHFESVPSQVGKEEIIWTGTLYDISKRKKAEHEIELRNKELLRINAEKDKFFSILAHDLKSPFNSILGFSNILVEKASQKDSESIRKYAA